MSPIYTKPHWQVCLLQDDDDDGNEPLDMSWPDSSRKRLTYMLVAPILFPLWLTLPDTRTPKGEFTVRYLVLDITTFLTLQLNSNNILPRCGTI